MLDVRQRLVGIVSLGDIASTDRHNDADFAESPGDICALSAGTTDNKA